MCGRSSLSKKEADLEKRFGAKFYSDEIDRYNPLPLFNIGPSMSVPVILDHEPERIQWVKWGFVPSWAKDAKASPPQINARIESVLEKPYFREAIQKRRCLVLLDGYFEWKAVNKTTKIPYYIHLQQTELFAVAGIWEEWNNQKAFSLITQHPNEALLTVHDRMPAILLPNQEKAYLESKTGEEAISMIRPFPQEKMSFHTVSKRINSSFDNDPTLLLPATHEDVPVQGSLF